MFITYSSGVSEIIGEKKMSESKYANPATLGLMAFGMTTVLLNLHNSGLFPIGSMILAMGLFFGGVAQVIAGIMEYRNNNMFGLTAFTAYGLFWMTLVALLVLPKLGLAEPASQTAMAAYLMIWGMFTALMAVSAARLNKALLTVFITLTILFVLLAIGQYNPLVHTIAGYEGIICGFTAIYTGFADITNDVYGKTVVPIWPIKK
jgi:succinate-acetate transporter protein